MAFTPISLLRCRVYGFRRWRLSPLQKVHFCSILPQTLILLEVEGLQKVSAKVIDGTCLIGYARAFSDDQSIDMQINTLDRAGCEVI